MLQSQQATELYLTFSLVHFNVTKPTSCGIISQAQSGSFQCYKANKLGNYISGSVWFISMLQSQQATELYLRFSLVHFNVTKPASYGIMVLWFISMLQSQQALCLSSVVHFNVTKPTSYRIISQVQSGSFQCYKANKLRAEL